MHFQENLEGSLWGKTRTGSVCTFSGKSGAEFARKEKSERNLTYCAGVGAEGHKKTKHRRFGRV